MNLIIIFGKVKSLQLRRTKPPGKKFEKQSQELINNNYLSLFD